MRAKDIISTRNMESRLLPMKTIDSEMPLLEVLPHLLDAPGRLLGVNHEGEEVGVIDEVSLLEGFGRLIAERDDSSVVTVECQPSQYSASALAHAVEDSGFHLVDLISHPAENGMLRVTLRVRSLDPMPAISSLERYGFRVVDMAPKEDAQSAILAERIASLQALMNV
ncbi:MAG: hypothetical protein K2M56_10585 [Muribaculaceae bacterium]|nr:hypothetical protein [Muribaculaceae bacterium]